MQDYNPNRTDYNPYVDRFPDDFVSPIANPFTLVSSKIRSVFAAKPKILIIDISHWNGVIDWPQVVASGVAGVIIKCSEAAEGTYYEYKDTKFEENWRAALDHGIAVMLYHFFRDNKGSAERDWFMKCADSYLNDERVNGKTAVWLDTEWRNSGVSKITRANRAFGFCELIRGAGFRQGIYCSPGLVNDLFPSNETRWNGVFQWNAHWTPAAQDTLPRGWSDVLRMVWQFGIYPTYSWAPEVNGAGTVDVNWGYWESAQALRDWMGQGQPPVPPTDCCDEHAERLDTHEVILYDLMDKVNQLTIAFNAMAEEQKGMRLDLSNLDKEIDDMNYLLADYMIKTDKNTLGVHSLKRTDLRVTEAYCGDGNE